MSIPNYEECMKPILDLTKDGKEYKMSEVVDILSEKLNLSEEDKKALLPSGQQTIIANRINWAKSYLLHAGLVESTRKGYFVISSRGKKFLEKCGDVIQTEDLLQFEEFKKFKLRSKVSRDETVALEKNESKSPDELLSDIIEDKKQELVEELKKRILKESSNFFERLVVKLFVAMGYGGTFEEAAKVIGKSGDGGIDGVIKEDRLGINEIYIQAKRWDNTAVGRPEIQKFVGALLGVSRGIFVTLSRFTKEAIDYANSCKSPKIILIDGDKLCDLMVEYDVGISTERIIKIKQIDSDFFDE